MEPCYKQHTAVDDRSGVVVDVDVTTGEASEGQQLRQQLQRIQNMYLTGAVMNLKRLAARAHSITYATPFTTCRSHLPTHTFYTVTKPDQHKWAA